MRVYVIVLNNATLFTIFGFVCKNHANVVNVMFMRVYVICKCFYGLMYNWHNACII